MAVDGEIAHLHVFVAHAQRHEDADEILGSRSWLFVDDDRLKSAGLGPLPPGHAATCATFSVAIWSLAKYLDEATPITLLCFVS